MVSLHWLDPSNENSAFPALETALSAPNGLLAMGGTLTPKRLITAYRQGIFPWYNEHEPILWWAPNPRFVLYPQQLKISRSLRKTLRNGQYRVTLDLDFRRVIAACAAPRARTKDTWLSNEMQRAYITLHELGHAHSVEIWREADLVGGLYGVALGQIFFGESMFSRCSDASKVGFVYLIRQLQHWRFAVVDCQVYTDYLASLGAELIARSEFSHLLAHHVDLPYSTGPWRFDFVRLGSDSIDIKKY